MPLFAMCSPPSPPELRSSRTSPAQLGIAPSNPTLASSSRGLVDALTAGNRPLVASSPFPSSPAAGCRRRNPPPPSNLRRIRAVGSSPLVPYYRPACSPSPVSPWPALPLAAVARRSFAVGRRLPPASPRGRHVSATSAPARLSSGRADPGRSLPVRAFHRKP
uniref:Uncharacterized protein n=1 Tax=Oryza sativa subsp. japonica TaxID=39947 RepID=Q5Z4G2_ORYSJ|nr:hypothetical protein [Oryza sativa Japonica Group]